MLSRVTERLVARFTLSCLRKSAQRAVRASRTVEVGGRGGWVRGRAVASPSGPDFLAALSRSLSQSRARNVR